MLLHITPILIGTALVLVAAAPLSAQGTHLWTQSRFDELEKGVPQGVQITSDGKLRIGPSANEIVTTPSTYVWGVAADKAGIAYLATGSPSRVLRVTPDGKTATLFETKALAVQALRLGPEGNLYAATLPDGKVYRLKTGASSAQDESTAEVVFDLAAMDGVKPGAAKSEVAIDRSRGALDKGAAKNEETKVEEAKPDAKSRYIWDMTFDTQGRLYIATGAPANVYRLDVKKKDAKPELYFKSDEQHIRTLAWDKEGDLIAGTDGSGLVYRIRERAAGSDPGDDGAGKGFVLFNAPRREVTALAVGADGSIYAADVGDKSRNPLPPLPVQSGSGITITFVQPGSMQAANASTTLPEGSEIFVLKPNEAPRKLWSDKDSVVYQLMDSGGSLTVLTGNRGRILTIHEDGSYADIAHLDAQQAVSMTETSGGWLVGTSNTGKLFRLSQNSAASADHSYASDVLDAGAYSRWGMVETAPDSRNYQIWTRSGNIEQPVRNAKDWGWSEWQATSGGKILSPAGRYLQWKAVLSANGEVGSVGVNYLPVNSAPVVDEIVVVPGARVMPQPAQPGQPGTVNIAFPSTQQNATFDGSTTANAPIQAQKDKTAVTVRWATHDDDGDDLTFSLYVRGDGEHVWRLLKKGLTDHVYSFDSAALPDGGYEIKVAASDSPSHPPGQALTGELTSERFELDTTPPVISELKASAPAAMECKQAPCPPLLSIPISFDAKDTTSPISHAEYSVDAGPWQYINPVGDLSDSKEEHYSVSVPVTAVEESAETEHLITVRVYDRHDNLAAAKAVVPAQAKAR
jgi:hypothetical protein